MFRNLYKGTFQYELPRITDDTEEVEQWATLEAYSSSKPYLKKGSICVEIIESTPQKRTVSIQSPIPDIRQQTNKYFLNIPYVQYTSVIPQSGKITNFITCSQNPFEKISDLSILPFPNIGKFCAVCVGEHVSEGGYSRPRDLAANFWQSIFNIDIIRAVQTTMEFNEIPFKKWEDFNKFFSVWEKGLKGIKYCPIDTKSNGPVHFVFKNTLGIISNG